MNDNSGTIKALGEIVLRTPKLGDMVTFYRDTLGLKPILETSDMVFFGLAPSTQGHTQVLGLFSQTIPPDHPEARQSEVEVSRSPVHHFAFAIGLPDYEREKERLEHLGLVVRTAEHPWIGARSVYIRDPDGNVVELVCHDESLRDHE